MASSPQHQLRQMGRWTGKWEWPNVTRHMPRQLLAGTLWSPLSASPVPCHWPVARAAPGSSLTRQQTLLGERGGASDLIQNGEQLQQTPAHLSTAIGLRPELPGQARLSAGSRHCTWGFRVQDWHMAAHTTTLQLTWSGAAQKTLSAHGDEVVGVDALEELCGGIYPALQAAA